MIKLTTALLTGSALLLLTACGGGSSSPTDDGSASSGGSTGSGGTITSGTAFYIDAAVSGVNYQCGSKEGITGSDGSFNFEEGKDCTFYIGDIMLRDIAGSDLKEGQKVYETDINVARVLQSLDTDHDLSNGITISHDIIEKMQSAGLTIAKLPTTDSEIDDLVKKIAENGGKYISKMDAQDHLASSNPSLYSFLVIDAASKESPDAQESITFTLNAEGNRATKTVESIVGWTGNGNGITSCEKETAVSTYTYDYVKNIVTEHVVARDSNSEYTHTWVYTFDTDKKLVKAEILENNVVEDTFNFYYSSAAKIEKITGTAEHFLMTFNEKGLPVREENDQGNGIISVDTYEYSAKGQLIKMTSTDPRYTQQQVITYQYHDNGKLKSVLENWSGQPHERLFNEDGMELDGNGNPVICQ